MKFKSLNSLKKRLTTTKRTDYLDLESRLFERKDETIERTEEMKTSNPLVSQEYVQKSLEHGEKIFNHQNLLQAESINNKKKILAEYEWDDDLKEIQDAEGRRLDREEQEELYKSDAIFFKDEISDVCRDLNLRFLPANKLLFFENDSKYQVIDVIEGYCSKLENSGGYEFESRKFYALAMEEDFSINGNTKPKSKEPRLMLFYMTDGEKKTFVHVETMGDSKFPVSRYISSWAYKSPSNFLLSRGVMFFGAAFILNSFIFSWSLLGIWFASVLAGFTVAGILTIRQMQHATKTVESTRDYDEMYVKNWIK